MKYIVKWGECFLAKPSFMGSVESRSTLLSMAQRYETEAAAKRRVTMLKKIRPVTDYLIIKVTT